LPSKGAGGEASRSCGQRKKHTPRGSPVSPDDMQPGTTDGGKDVASSGQNPMEKNKTKKRTESAVQVGSEIPQGEATQGKKKGDRETAL